VVAMRSSGELLKKYWGGGKRRGFCGDKGSGGREKKKGGSRKSRGEKTRSKNLVHRPPQLEKGGGRGQSNKGH